MAQRAPTFFTVTGPDNSPLAGAAVVAVATPNLAAPWPLDVRSGLSDARGRAQFELEIGRVYI